MHYSCTMNNARVVGKKKKKKKKAKYKREKSKTQTKLTLKVCLDTVFFAKNWKYCSKIIFKCVNSIMRPIFNESFGEKRDYGSHEQYTGPTEKHWTRFSTGKKKSMKRRRTAFQPYPNGYFGFQIIPDGLDIAVKQRKKRL